MGEKNDEEYEVDRIVGERVIKNKVQYKVRWVGYGTDDESWENESQLDCPDMLEEYLQEKIASETNTNATKRTGRKKQNINRGKEDSENNVENPEPEASSSSSLSGTAEAPLTKRSRGQTKNDVEKPKDEPSETSIDYEVEKLIDKRILNGKTQFKVRWLGYGDEDDTWENESNLDCPDLINAYRDTTERSTKMNGKRNKMFNKRKTSLCTGEEPPRKGAKEETSANGENEYEVDRILDMYIYRDGSRKFLVKWVGFNRKDSTWEPEENLKGIAALTKYLEKVNNTKQAGAKQLRQVRKPTDRFTVLTSGKNRRHSKRNANKQRVEYFDPE